MQLMINNLVKRISHKLMVLSLFRPQVTRIDLITLGDKLASWTIPSRYLDKNSKIICVGAGENISFEMEIVKLYNSKVHLFDPTPKSKAYVMKIISKIDLLNFYEIGISDFDGNQNFYSPKNKEHVSYSLVNIQNTDDFIEVKVNSLLTIMKSLDFQEIDLLKLDIEGAEYQVIDYILENKIEIKIFCVEFDEVFHQIDSDFKIRIKNYVKKLIDHGFVCVNVTLYQNYTFVHKKYL